MKRSAEEARENRHAPSVSAPSQPQVAARSPARRAPVASKRRAKTWIERTAPTVQSLVTQPQMALLGAVEDVGVDPQLAAYQPQQPTAADLLPDHATAPMALDVLPSPDRREAVLREVHPASKRPEAPRAPDQTWRVLMTAPVTGPTPTAGPVPVVTGPAPVEVVVAGLDAAHQMSDVAPDQDLPASAAIAETLAPEVTLRDPDPLDVLEGAVFQTAAIEDAFIQVAAVQATVVEATAVQATAIGDSPLEAEKESPGEDAVAEMAEVEIASLDAVVPDTPPAEVGPTDAVAASLPLVEVANGTGRLNMAARIRDHLKAEGITVKRLTNADHYRHQETTIYLPSRMAVLRREIGPYAAGDHRIGRPGRAKVRHPARIGW